MAEPRFSDDDAFLERTDDEDNLESEGDEDKRAGDAHLPGSLENAAAERGYGGRLESKIRALLAKARARSEYGDQPFDSNYEYVRDRIDPEEYSELDAIYWTVQPRQLRLRSGGREKDAEAVALIVDDDAFTAREYGLLLSSRGIHVKYAFSADDALRLLNHFRDIFDFITIDIRMPSGDYFGAFSTAGGARTGISLAEEVSTYAPSATRIALTNSVDALDISWFEGQEEHFIL